MLIREAKKIDIQVVVTSHSSDLLKHICKKIEYNNNDRNNDIELYYFTNANRRLEVKRNPEYSIIESDLMIVSVVQSNNRVKVYSEDEENRWFLKNLIQEFIPYLEILDVRIGCDQLLSLYTGDISYFGNVLISLDGDVTDKQLGVIPEQLRRKLNNILRLPGEDCPEKVFYQYLLSLEGDHPYWEHAERLGMTWTYFRENGPLSSHYSGEKDREKYKEWFQQHLQVFNSTNLFEFWKKDNLCIVEEFEKKFIECYNSVASRTLARKIIKEEK